MMARGAVGSEYEPLAVADGGRPAYPPSDDVNSVAQPRYSFSSRTSDNEKKMSCIFPLHAAVPLSLEVWKRNDAMR